MSLPPGAMAQVENIPATTLLRASTPFLWAIRNPTALPDRAANLMHDGKREILYVGANYCPYWAAERWAMVMELSQFGTF